MTVVAFLALVAKALTALAEAEEAATLLEAAAVAVRSALAGDGKVPMATVFSVIPPKAYEPGLRA